MVLAEMVHVGILGPAVRLAVVAQVGRAGGGFCAGRPPGGGPAVSPGGDPPAAGAKRTARVVAGEASGDVRQAGAPPPAAPRSGGPWRRSPAAVFDALAANGGPGGPTTGGAAAPADEGRAAGHPRGREDGPAPAPARSGGPAALRELLAHAPGSEDVGSVAASTIIEAEGQRWLRLVIRTHVIQPGEDIAAAIERHVRPHLRSGDWVFVGQKAVSIAQRRLVREEAVRPRRLAVLLSRHVRRTPFGRGLGRPATMEIALREAGTARILLAAAVHVLGRPFGRRGDFYRIAGRRVASIDGVTDWALPPFNKYIVLHPTDAEGVARRIARRIGAPAAVVDLNDLGGAVLGASPGIDRRVLLWVVRDNPLGQGPFRTPVGIARRLDRP